MSFAGNVGHLRRDLGGLGVTAANAVHFCPLMPSIGLSHAGRPLTLFPIPWNATIGSRGDDRTSLITMACAWQCLADRAESIEEEWPSPALAFVAI
jgi:hypothetical protein